MLRYVIVIAAMLGSSAVHADTIWFCRLNKKEGITRFLVRDKSLIDLEFYDLIKPLMPNVRETDNKGGTYQIISDTPDVIIALQSSVNFVKAPLGATIILTFGHLTYVTRCARLIGITGVDHVQACFDPRIYADVPR
jgi:hypothetical protein